MWVEPVHGIRKTAKFVIDNVLGEVLQMETQTREAEKLLERDDKMGDDISASAADQDQNMVEDEAAQLSAVDIALNSLLHNAIEEFGLAPRDVFYGVFCFHEMKSRHDKAIQKLNYSTLKTLVQAFAGELAIDEFSHHVVSVYPEEGLPRLDDWKIDFKSNRIATKVMELMRSEEDARLQELYNFFHQIPESSILAGRIFEARVHRMLSDGWRSNSPVPQPIRMVSDSTDPPLFSVNPSSSSSSIPDDLLPSLAPVRDHNSTRAVISITPIAFATGLSNVTLENNKYYIPTAPNNPLFDSFTIDVHDDQSAVVISVFQMTTCAKHDGSARGYLLIRKIIARVRKLCKGVGKGHFRIHIAYFLVFPEGKPQHKWQMPEGWGERCKTNDHRGNAFCISVPVSVCHRFTAKFAT